MQSEQQESSTAKGNHPSSPVAFYLGPGEEFKVYEIIRDAYMAGKPLYPPEEIARLRQSIKEREENPGLPSTIQMKDFFGFEFEQDLESASRPFKIRYDSISYRLVWAYKLRKHHPAGLHFCCYGFDKPSSDEFPPLSTHRPSADVVEIRKNMETHQDIARFLLDVKTRLDLKDYRTEVIAALHEAFNYCDAQNTKPITKVIGFGLCNIEYAAIEYEQQKGDAFSEHVKQHFLASDIRDVLTGRSRKSVRFLLQDPCITDPTSGEKVLAYKIIKGDIWDEIDENSLVLSVNRNIPVKEIVAEFLFDGRNTHRLPRAMIWDGGSPMTMELMETYVKKGMTCVNTPRTNKLEERYKEFKFPNPPPGVPNPFMPDVPKDSGLVAGTGLTIYVRKEDPITDQPS
ncbi:hypothetical protein F5Y19DRAFT_145977 [Xylariaceae sp. FL1651]|nr:hypothetical protein F5Y19DRAFT_145977 [Xylariaceae sp. FL1651]